MPTKRRPSKTHRPNGPYLPLGFLGNEYCVKCGHDWPCPADLVKQTTE